MSYVHKIAHRLNEPRRVSGAEMLRVELSRDDGDENDAFVAHGSDSAPKVNKISKNQMSSADFEEWIKLATDNKINSTNSWNLALIDYFHEMSLLKEGDNINFQKASATLDGCVKIYSSRVDSVATETGRLLTGLAHKNDATVGAGSQDGGSENDGSGDTNTDPGATAGSGEKVATNRSRQLKHGATLVTFSAIHMRKLDQELEIDPLFKRALSEFDEGGAKSLLMNILGVGNDGRVLFAIKDEDEAAAAVTAMAKHTSSDAKDNSVASASAVAPDQDQDQDQDSKFEDVSVFKKFFDNVDDLKVCPSMESVDSVLRDLKNAKDFFGQVQKDTGALENGQSDVPMQPSPSAQPETPNLDAESGSVPEGNLASFDMDAEFDFDDLGADLDANDVYNEEENQLDAEKNAESGAKDVNEPEDGEEAMMETADKNLMAYFDQNIKVSWAGPDHWKVRMLKRKEAGTKAGDAPAGMAPKSEGSAAPGAKKRKQEFLIDFNASLDDEAFEEELFKTGKKINMPKAQEVSADFNLLPDDLYFGSERLLRLFCKPASVRSLKRIMKARAAGAGAGFAEGASALDGVPENGAAAGAGAATEGEVEVENILAINEAADEKFWADQYAQNEHLGGAAEDGSFEFNGGMEFGDDDAGSDMVKEENEIGTQESKFSGMDVRKVRPEYVNFSRTAKKVDVKYLKDNLWECIDRIPEKEIEFSEVVKKVASRYPRDERKDLSTSFFFICVLHLANEHGLEIVQGDDLMDLRVIKPAGLAV